MPPFGGQSIRDKTSEFRAVADRLRKEQVGSGPGVSPDSEAVLCASFLKLGLTILIPAGTCCACW